MYIDDEEATYEWGVRAIDNGKRGGAFTQSRFDPSGSSVEEYMLPRRPDIWCKWQIALPRERKHNP